MKKFIYILIGVVVLAGIVFVIVAPARGSGPGKYDAFATCIAKSGATFYGAFWCPHCQAEKARFGSSAHLLPYVECSNPDGQGQNQTCNDKKIQSYPTWEFSKSITLESPEAPHKCLSANESTICQNAFRPDMDAWVVGSIGVGSNNAPVQNATSTKWTFSPPSRIYGDLPLETLSEVSACQLPQ